MYRAFLAAIDLVIPGRWLDDSLRSDHYSLAVDIARAHLDRFNPRVKGRLIEPCVSLVASDGRLTLDESELLCIIGVHPNCPVPPLMQANIPIRL